MFKTVNALVLREVRYKEADRILTLFTDTEGKITAKARGALRKSSRTAAATQQLTYSEMTLFGNKGRWTVNEAIVKEGFEGLRCEMERLALGAYFAECMEAFGVEDQPEPALLQLGLNCLYALSRGLYPPAHIKAAFELRLMCIAGFAPSLDRCAVCGREDPEQPRLSLYGGTVLCAGCVPQGAGKTVPLGPAGLSAMRHVTEAEAKRIFSFSLDGDAAPQFEEACERYALAQLDRGFRTLDYWKSVSAFPYNG